MVRRIELIRDNHLLEPEAVIRNLTGLAADVAHLEGVGYLKEGMAADICVIDYDHVKANSDYIHPFRKNEGIEYVLVNGKIAVEHGEATGVRNGRVLKRAK